jgi:hypothetical protein
MANIAKRTYTAEELAFREGLSGKLASIEGKIDGLHIALKPVLELNEVVTLHDRQIHRWMGVNAVLAGVATVFASVYAKYKQWI